MHIGAELIVMVLFAGFQRITAFLSNSWCVLILFIEGNLRVN